MKKLKLTTKPKKLTLGQMWKLSLLDTGIDTPDFMISVLDAFYPKASREEVEITTKIRKYEESLPKYRDFLLLIKGMG